MAVFIESKLIFICCFTIGISVNACFGDEGNLVNGYLTNHRFSPNSQVSIPARYSDQKALRNKNYKNQVHTNQFVGTSAAAVAQSTGSDVQSTHMQGNCGSMGVGTGLSGTKGWIVSMLPGKHEVRIRSGTGRVFLTTAKLTSMDFDAGRPYYITMEGISISSIIEWKVPNADWSDVPKQFLYPIRD